MGCWNGTDLITQLPIMYGDKVVLIPIKQSNHIKEFNAESPCYSNIYFKPLPVLLYGEYDDYGCISEITGDIEQFKVIVQKESKLSGDDILEIVDKDFGGDYSENESYVRFVERGNIEKIGYVLIHKELFDNLKDYNDYWESKDVNEYYDSITYKRRLKEAKENNVPEKEILKMMIDNFGSWDTFDRIDLDEVNKESISFIISISSVLGITRKYWMPQTGAGGQVQIEQPHRVIQEFYNKYIENYYKECEE